MDVDLSKIKKAYIIGIKGSGIVAIVEILHQMGVEISGSDTGEKFFTDETLAKLDIKYHPEFDAKNVPKDTDLVVYSSSYNAENNPEVAEAQRLKLKMASYPEMLAYFFNEKFGIAVCGTHGKTTTSALLANTLKDYGSDPSAVIGSKVLNWGGSALVGQGDIFVAEVDEYQNKLRYYDPSAVILTSCDWDHPDFFEDFNNYKSAFKDFVERIPENGFLVVWGDSTDTLEIAESAKCPVVKYGIGDDCDYQVTNMALRSAVQTGEKNWQTFEVMRRGESLGVYQIQLIGKHNILNAVSVIALCDQLVLKNGKIRAAIKNFRGTARRFQNVGQFNGALIIDDYGHHPEEIRATLRGARGLFPKKNIWVVFHPHTYTRTRALLSEFAQSFSDAYKVVVLDIYGSARENRGGVHSADLVKLTNMYDYGKAEYISTIEEAADYLKKNIGGDDVLITMGAGDVWKLGEMLKE